MFQEKLAQEEILNYNLLKNGTHLSTKKLEPGGKLLSPLKLITENFSLQLIPLLIMQISLSQKNLSTWSGSTLVVGVLEGSIEDQLNVLEHKCNTNYLAKSIEEIDFSAWDHLNEIHICNKIITGFEGELLKVHPTQIYESVICSILFVLFWRQRQNPIIKPKLFFLYLIFAGIERFFIEFIRTNEKYVLDIFSGAQIISFFLILIGIYFSLYYEIEETAEST